MWGSSIRSFFGLQVTHEQVAVEIVAAKLGEKLVEGIPGITRGPLFEQIQEPIRLPVGNGPEVLLR